MKIRDDLSYVIKIKSESPGMYISLYMLVILATAIIQYTLPSFFSSPPIIPFFSIFPPRYILRCRVK